MTKTAPPPQPSAATASPEAFHTRELLLKVVRPDSGRPILIVLLLATVLRIPGMYLYPYEQDELYTVFEATDLFQTTLEPGIDARPLYYLLQHALFYVLPQTPVGLRLPPFIFGILGIWLTWIIGARLYGRTAGLVAALLVAISPWHLHVSGMARYWSLVYLLAAGFFFFLVRSYSSDRPRDHLSALLMLSAGMLTHPTLLFPAAGASLAATLVRDDGQLGWRNPTRRCWIYLWVPFGLLLATFGTILSLLGREKAVQNWDGRGWLATLRLIPAIVDWATPTLVVAGGMGMVLLIRFAANPSQRRWAMMGLLGCWGGVVLLSFASLRTDVYADYAIGMLPLLFVSAGALIQRSVEGHSVGSTWIAWALTLILVAGMLPSTVSHLSSGTRFDYRPAYRHILGSEPEVMVMTWPLVLQAHYAPQLNARPLWMDTQYLGSTLRRERDLWVIAPVRQYGIPMDDSGAVARWLTSHCTQEMAYQRFRVDSRRYRVELYRCRLRS